MDVEAVFEIDGGAYFKIDDLQINDRAVNLDDTTFAGRWSDLEALLQAQNGEGASPDRK